MEDNAFDALSRSLVKRQSRRVVGSLLGGLLALPAVDWATAGGKKGKKRKKKRKGGGKGSKNPPVCIPNCGGSNTQCDVSDGCGGTCACAAGSMCNGRTCHVCDVVHDGNDVTSGQALRQKLAIAVDDDTYVYVCPGRYVGYVTHAGGNVVGAGDGADPATNTILDLAGGTVPGAAKAVFMVDAGAVSRVYSLRITGSTKSLTHGLYVPSNSQLTLDSSTVTGNKGPGITGINADGAFELVDCTISDNGSTDDLPYTYYGGGVRAANDLVSDIIGCRITNNIAGGSGGGGVYIEGGSLNIFSTEISGNTVRNAVARGGGIYQVSGDTRLRADNRITGNTAGATGRGGGIYRQGGTITWEGPTVSQNSPNNCVGVSECAG